MAENVTCYVLRVIHFSW